MASDFAQGRHYLGSHASGQAHRSTQSALKRKPTEGGLAQRCVGACVPRGAAANGIVIPSRVVLLLRPARRLPTLPPKQQHYVILFDRTTFDWLYRNDAPLPSGGIRVAGWVVMCGGGGWWRVAVGGWWIVVGGLWLVGWWLVVGDVRGVVPSRSAHQGPIAPRALGSSAPCNDGPLAPRGVGPTGGIAVGDSAVVRPRRDLGDDGSHQCPMRGRRFFSAH